VSDAVLRRPAFEGDVLTVDGVPYRAVGWDASVDPPVYVYQPGVPPPPDARAAALARRHGPGGP